ncbi:hypothetical protein PFISCL1PPCAC_4030, partial [Pristionchus fissidentatus]
SASLHQARMSAAAMDTTTAPDWSPQKPPTRVVEDAIRDIHSRLARKVSRCEIMKLLEDYGVVGFIADVCGPPVLSGTGREYVDVLSRVRVFAADYSARYDDEIRFLRFNGEGTTSNPIHGICDMLQAVHSVWPVVAALPASAHHLYPKAEFLLRGLISIVVHIEGFLLPSYVKNENLVNGVCWDYVVTNAVQTRLLLDKSVLESLQKKVPAMTDVYKCLTEMTVDDVLGDTRAKFSAFYMSAATLLQHLTSPCAGQNDKPTYLVGILIKSASVISAYEKFVADFVVCRKKRADVARCAYAVDESFRRGVQVDIGYLVPTMG